MSAVVAGAFATVGSVEATGRGGLISEVKSMDCSGAISEVGSVVVTLATRASCALAQLNAPKNAIRATAGKKRFAWRKPKFTGPDNSRSDVEMQSLSRKTAVRNRGPSPQRDGGCSGELTA